MSATHLDIDHQFRLDLEPERDAVRICAPWSWS